MGRATVFTSPFATPEQARAMVRRFCEIHGAMELEIFAAGKKLMVGQEMRQSIQADYRWKLGSFRKRFAWVDAFPPESEAGAIDAAFALARKAMMADESSTRIALSALTAVNGVGIPVASAFLTAMHPDQFTIIDRQAYKALKAPFRSSIAEYLAYLRFCHAEAARLGLTLRQHDQVLWLFGSQVAERFEASQP